MLQKCDTSHNMDFNKTDMASGSDSQGLDVSTDNPKNAQDHSSADTPDSGEGLQQSTTVRRKRRKRNFAPASTEYSRTHTGPVYVAPAPEIVSERRRRRSRRRWSSRRNYRKVLRIVIYVTIHVVFITFLIFLWMKISAKVTE
jgi:hypothetical protein